MRGYCYRCKREHENAGGYYKYGHPAHEFPHDPCGPHAPAAVALQKKLAAARAAAQETAVLEAGSEPDSGA